MTMITPSYLGETIEYSSLHACRSTLEDPTCQRGRHRRGGVRSRKGFFSAVLHDPLYRHRRRNLRKGARVARRRFVWRRDWPSDHPARWSGMSLRGARLFGTPMLRPVAGARLWPVRQGVDAGRRFRGSLCEGPRIGAKGCNHVAEPAADCNRRRHCEGGRPAFCSIAQRNAPANHELVGCSGRYSTIRTTRR